MDIIFFNLIISMFTVEKTDSEMQAMFLEYANW